MRAQVWVWRNKDGSTDKYYDAADFQRALRERHLHEDLRALLPTREGRPAETPAEAQLRSPRLLSRG